MYHHYPVSVGSDDGEAPSQDEDEGKSGNDEPPSDYEEDQDEEDGEEPYPNGIYKDEDGKEWTYDVHDIPCDDALDHGQDCESPVERHWIESEVLEWIQIGRAHV